jgi:hypothetical protein
MKLVVFILLIVCMVILFYFNQWLQQLIRPRESFVRLITYILVAFALLFLFTFLFVFFISNLFPLSKR